MPPEEDFTPGDILPDDIIEAHLDAAGAPPDGGEDPDPEAPPPDDKGAAPAVDPDQPPAGDPDDDPDDDDDDDDDGDDEPDDDIDDDDDEDEEDEEEDFLDDRLSAEDLELIENDPLLKKAHKQMQGAFTRKTTDVARRNDEVTRREGRISTLEQTLANPQGMATFLARTMEQRPDVIASAFESVAQGENAEAFLVEVGLSQFETLERAFDRVQELRSDETELRRHTDGRKLQSERADVDREKQAIRERNFDTSMGEVLKAEDKALKKAGIVDKEDQDAVRREVRKAIKEKVQKDGSIAMTPKDVRAIVGNVKKQLDAVEARVRARMEQAQVQDSKKRVKEKASKRGGKKRVPPGSAPSRTPPPPQKFEPSGRGDPLDQYIDARITAS